MQKPMGIAKTLAIAGLLLAGVAINALCGSLLALVHYFASPDVLRSIIFWSMGSFAQASWPQLACPLLFSRMSTPPGRRRRGAEHRD